MPEWHHRFGVGQLVNFTLNRKAGLSALRPGQCASFFKDDAIRAAAANEAFSGIRAPKEVDLIPVLQTLKESPAILKQRLLNSALQIENFSATSLYAALKTIQNREIRDSTSKALRGRLSTSEAAAFDRLR